MDSVDKKLRYKMEEKRVDCIISKELEDVTNSVCSVLEQKEVNVIDTKELIELIKKKNKFVQDLFDEGMTEHELEIQQRFNIMKENNRGALNSFANEILSSEINKRILKMIQNANTPEKLVVLSDRRMFLNGLFQVLGQEDVNKFIKSEKER